MDTTTDPLTVGGATPAPSTAPTTTPVTTGVPADTTTTGPAPRATTTATAPMEPFVEATDAEFNAMSPAEQSAYLDKQKAAETGQAVPAAPAPTPKPTAAEIRAGNLTPDQIATLSYQEQQNYKNSQARSQAASPLGAGKYVPPPPAQASDYVTDKQFIPQIKDPVTGQMRDVTDADVPKPVNWDVTPDQTVQGQMAKLTTDLQTNPVYQSLAEQLKRTSAAAGGGNSLMAETAAYNQVIGLAYNIATNDAATYAKSAEFNASMANQFGLAEGAFIHTALLSDQNYKQSQILQSEQIKGNLDSVDRQVAGQLESTRIAGEAQIGAARVQASGQVGAARAYADASIQNAKLSAETSLKEAEMSRQTTLDGLGIQFQSNWALQQGGIAGDIEKIGVQAGYQKDLNAANNADQFSKSLTLQNNADFNANLRQLMANIGQIGATPGLTSEQQANAIKTETEIFKTNTALTNSAYGSAAHGIADGSISNSLSNPTATTQPTAQNPYGIYGNYMAFPGFDTTPPPVLPYFGGSGAQQNVGAQNPNLPASPVANGPTFIPPQTATPP